jgi:ABC-type oligopeptide transport system substrate-binding subunit
MLATVRSLPLLLLALLAVVPPAAAAEGKRLDLAESGYLQLDPVLIRSSGDERVVTALFECLTTLDPATGKAAPGAAASWQVDATGTSWTFALRPDAKWSDGKPVVAKDFVYAWKRAIDPFNKAPQALLFRPLRGMAALHESNLALEAIDVLSKGLREAIEANPTGIPGGSLASLVEDSGARIYIERLESKDVRRMIKWGEEPFPVEKATEARKAITAERKKYREVLERSAAAFGTSSGVLAKDDKTLVVETEGRRPWLPELVARAVFAPLREDVLLAKRDAAFEPSGFVGNGPYRLKGRGSKPRPGLDKPDSVVHLSKNTAYTGPNAGVLDDVFCWTDLGQPEERRRFAGKTLQWMAAPSREARKELEKDPAYRAPPTGSVLCLVIRCDRKPFDNKEARRAFALAVERASLAKLLWPAGDPAERIVPPGIRGVSPGVNAPKGSAAEAKAAVKAVGLPPDEWPWTVVFHEDADGPSSVAQALIEGWTKTLGIESSANVNTGEAHVRALVLGGKFAFVLREVIGPWNDPSAFLEPFHTRHPECFTGWRDEAFDLMIEGLHDVDALAAKADKVLAVAKDAAGLTAKIEAAKTGVESAKEALRQALLVEAEQRLLSEYVVVPIAFPRRAELVQDVKGIGSEEAWKNPAFVGSLRAATR